MPATIQFETNDVYVVRIRGVLKRSEFAMMQDALTAKIEAGAKPRILVIGENFEGWERGAGWEDMGFLLSYGDKIEKIAIVGNPKWAAEAMAFAGAGFRPTPVKFFSHEELPAARSWLDQLPHGPETRVAVP